MKERAESAREGRPTLERQHTEWTGNKPGSSSERDTEEQSRAMQYPQDGSRRRVAQRELGNADRIAYQDVYSSPNMPSNGTWIGCSEDEVLLTVMHNGSQRD